MDPAGMMMGMAMGQMMGRQMSGTARNTMQQHIPPAPAVAPPPQYSLASGGQVTGPYDMKALAQMARNGGFTSQSLVWKQGMDGWAAAGTVRELLALLSLNAPPAPPPLPEQQ